MNCRRFGARMLGRALRLAGACVIFWTVPYAGYASPRVDVTFVEPALFTDAFPTARFDQKELHGVISALRAHIEQLAARYLKDGDLFALEVLDIDLAGQLEVWPARARDVRILRSADVPRIHLRYELIIDGVRRSGDESIADLGYLETRCQHVSPLCHEMRLLDRWFAETIAPLASRPGK
jgi:hypothetical protein